jgi:hypothetical protein
MADIVKRRKFPRWSARRSVRLTPIYEALRCMGSNPLSSTLRRAEQRKCSLEIKYDRSALILLVDRSASGGLERGPDDVAATLLGGLGPAQHVCCGQRKSPADCHRPLTARAPSVVWGCSRTGTGRAYATG